MKTTSSAGPGTTRYKLTDPPPAVASEQCSKAHLILRYAHDTCNSMLRTYRSSLRERGKERKSARGAPTDEQMDLLRAMLVFAGAGLDSMLKQLIHDAIPVLSSKDEGVRKGIETFATRRLRFSAEDDASFSGSRFLANALLAEAPREAVLEAYVDELTGGSLQSASELSRSISALGLQPGPVLSIYTWLGEAFRVRNQIVHELDINFEHPKRNRQTRPLGKMINLTNDILKVSAHVLALVDEKVMTNGDA